MTSSDTNSNNATTKRWDIIKTENGKQRISQLCDRCCTKKIKCDGAPGGCSNCLRIGFFCKTTDKLNRSSFPKGYTKTLEKQVVELELANNKMKLELELLLLEKKERQTHQGVDQADRKLVNGQNNDSISGAAEDDDFFNFSTDFLDQPPTEFLFKKTEHYLHRDFLAFDQQRFNPLQTYLTSSHGLMVLNDTADQQDEERNVDLNLILIKYLKPLLHKDPNATESFLNDNKMDNLITKFFKHFNKLIPILDFKRFCNQYLNFFNKFDIDSLTENSDFEKNYHYDSKDKNFILKLLMIIKFNLNSNSLLNRKLGDLDNVHFDYTAISLEQLKELCAAHINYLEPSIDNLEVCFLLLSYLHSFEIGQCTFIGNLRPDLGDWCYQLLSLSLHYVNSMGLNVNTENLVIGGGETAMSNAETGSGAGTSSLSDLELLIEYKFVRLKLYWSFRILLRSIKIEFNYNLKNLKMMTEVFKPDSLETVYVFEDSLKYTTQLLLLLRLVPINFMELSQFELDKVELDLDVWFENFINMSQTATVANDSANEENTALSKLLLSKYHYYKFFVNKDKSCKETILNGYSILQSMLTYEFKPKVTRGRKKRNYHEMLEQQQQRCLNGKPKTVIDLIGRLNDLSKYQTLKMNELLSCSTGSFINFLLIACLHKSKMMLDIASNSLSILNEVDVELLGELKSIYKIFSIGLPKRSNLQDKILNKFFENLSNVLLRVGNSTSEIDMVLGNGKDCLDNSIQAKTIDISKEFNDLHQSFLIEPTDCTPLDLASTSSGSQAIVVPQSPASTTISFDMSRNSSISTTATFMSRTPSLKVGSGNTGAANAAGHSSISESIGAIAGSRRNSLANPHYLHQRDHDSDVEVKVEVESLFGNFNSWKSKSVSHNTAGSFSHIEPCMTTKRGSSYSGTSSSSSSSKSNSNASKDSDDIDRQMYGLFKDDRDLMRLKQQVINMSK